LLPTPRARSGRAAACATGDDSRPARRYGAPEGLDVVIIDVRMPSSGGCAVCRRPLRRVTTPHLGVDDSVQLDGLATTPHKPMQDLDDDSGGRLLLIGVAIAASRQVPTWS